MKKILIGIVIGFILNLVAGHLEMPKNGTAYYQDSIKKLFVAKGK